MDVRALIDSLDVTPADLARRLGISDGHVFDIKSGRRRLTVELAARIETVTGRNGIVDAVVRERTAA